MVTELHGFGDDFFAFLLYFLVILFFLANALVYLLEALSDRLFDSFLHLLPDARNFLRVYGTPQSIFIDVFAILVDSGD